MPFIHAHSKGEWSVQKVYRNDFELHIPQTKKEKLANLKLASQSPKLLQIVEMYHDELVSRNENSIVLSLIKNTLKESGVKIEKKDTYERKIKSRFV